MKAHGACARTTFAPNSNSQVNPFWEKSMWKERKEKERIMPSLVATKSALARTTCVSTHNMREHAFAPISKFLIPIKTFGAAVSSVSVCPSVRGQRVSRSLPDVIS